MTLSDEIPQFAKMILNVPTSAIVVAVNFNSVSGPALTTNNGFK